MKLTLLFIACLVVARVSSLAQSSSALAEPSPRLSLPLGTGESLELVLVQAGSFTQGSPLDEAGREADETPREVTLTQAFYMGVSPITRGQFERFVITSRYRTESERGPSGGFGVENGKLVQGKQYTWRNPGFAQSQHDPVTGVAFTDAQAFCQWLTKTQQRVCDLPTESQWEYACRAGTRDARYAEPVDAVAWHRGNSMGTTHPVGLLKPNAWGLHDVYGSVWQWCADWYAPYDAAALRDPLQKQSALSDRPRRVLRGGSFLSDASHSRSAERYRNDPLSRNADNGFRIVCAVNALPTPMPAPSAAKTPTASPPTTLPSPRRVLPSTASPPHPRVTREQNSTATGVASWVGSLACFAVPLGLLFFVIRGVLGKRAGSGAQGLHGAALASSAMSGSATRPRQPPSLGSRGLRTRLGIDGFWIEGPAEAAGQAIRYQFIVNGQPFANEVIFSPGPEGHFVFAGGTPTSASVVATSAGLSTGNASEWSASSGSNSSSSSFDANHGGHRSSGASTHFPSAY